VAGPSTLGAGTMTITQDDPRTKLTAARRVEIFTGAGRRRSRSAEEKVRIIAESMAEGANVSAMARTHGLTPAQIFRWRRSGVLSKAAPPPALSFAPVVVEEKVTTLAAGEVIEIELKGAKLRVPAGTRPATIVALVKALRSSR
jgi:transposase